MCPVSLRKLKLIIRRFSLPRCCLADVHLLQMRRRRSRRPFTRSLARLAFDRRQKREDSKVSSQGNAYYVKSLALSLLNSCGVKRRITDRTRTRFGLISLFSKNCRMTFRRYCPSASVQYTGDTTVNSPRDLLPPHLPLVSTSIAKEPHWEQD